jgi:hypothetical protein
MTEAIYPTILHQDPRISGVAREARGQGYYRRSSRLLDSFRFGGMQFNYSEVLGNSTTVAISNGYYQDNRDAGDAVTKLGMHTGKAGRECQSEGRIGQLNLRIDRRDIHVEV